MKKTVHKQRDPFFQEMVKKKSGAHQDKSRKTGRKAKHKKKDW